jgi:hypothetical protein
MERKTTSSGASGDKSLKKKRLGKEVLLDVLGGYFTHPF